METPLGRWLLIGLVLLVAIGLFLLVPAVLRLAEPEVLPPVTVPTSTPIPPTATPTVTPSATPSPAPTLTPAPSATPLPVQVGYNVHAVVQGETLERIAQRYGSLVPAIASLNRFPLDAPIAVGQPLVIPLFADQGVTQTIPLHGLEVERGLPGRRVALTLDAGASAEPAIAILDTLRAYNVHITFFITGKWAEENPDLVRRIAAEGHEIGNHTYSHPNLTDLDDAALQDEVLRTERIIRELVGQTTRPLLRPPYGDRDQRVWDVLAQMGYISIYWTVDSLDSVGDPKTPEFLLERVTGPTIGGKAIPLEGAIILMHVGNASTAQALPAILDWFSTEGYQVVPVSAILRAP